MTLTDRQWQEVKAALRLTMTQGTFKAYLANATLLPTANGRVHLAVPSQAAADWCNARLMPHIRRAVRQVTGSDPELLFQVRTASPPTPVDAPDIEPVFDFLPLWRKTGYSQLPHYVSQFWIPYLTPNVFAVWNALLARDTRDLRPPEHRWTPPLEITFRRLARLTGARSHKTISGRKDECGVSRARRLAGQPVTAPCPRCPHPVHQRLPGPDGDNRCRYWRPGALEILHREQLLALEVVQTSHHLALAFSLSVYRLLPLLTPAQVDTLPTAVRRAHRRWLSAHEPALGLSLNDWQAIDAPSLVTRQPGYHLKPLHGRYQFNRILADQTLAVQESAELGRNQPFRPTPCPQ